MKMDTYQIWQIADTRNVYYAWQQFLPNMEKHLKFSDYKKVYEGETEFSKSVFAGEKAIAHRIWTKHNAPDRPAPQSSRSASVSDIFVINTTDGVNVLYVDPFGFKDISEQCPDAYKDFVENCDSAPFWDMQKGEELVSDKPCLDAKVAEAKVASANPVHPQGKQSQNLQRG